MWFAFGIWRKAGRARVGGMEGREAWRSCQIGGRTEGVETPYFGTLSFIQEGLHNAVEFFL